MKLVQNVVLTSAGMLALSNTAWGQSPEAAGASPIESRLEEIIVTARRKEERLQDVPSTVNVVTGENIEKLAIREFQDIQSVVPGLNLAGTNVVNATASVRGITFNQVTSGNNGVIEFYLNDSPQPASSLFQVMYDIGQIELLRGPQGTLRGRAAPAGSMTVATRRPTLNEWGGHANATGTDEGEYNFNGAVNVPIVDDMLALRVAALYDVNDANGVESVNNTTNPESKTKSGRATLRFEPTDDLSFILTYQTLENTRLTFTHMESMSAFDPSAPASPVFIAAGDRRSVTDTVTDASTTVDTFNLQAQWAFLGQRLNYVGSDNHIIAEAREVFDLPNRFGPSDPAFAQGYGANNRTNVRMQAHELRLSSEEQVFGMFDYIIGAFLETVESPTKYANGTILLFPPPAGRVLYTSIHRLNETEEQSAFANLTLHLGADTEISAGLRYLEYTADAGLLQNGVPVAAIEQHDDFDTTIYTGSIKHRFNDDLMLYGLVGTSWRPGVTVVGDFNLTPSPLEVDFTQLDPEESTSYEIGLKASAFDQRLRANLSIFRQEYDNNPWRSPSFVYFVNTAPTGTSVVGFNFAGAVPVTVDGVEAELYFAPTDRWDVNLNATFTKSEIDNGFVPCNDYLPHDGIPDTGSAIPTIAQIQAVSGGENLTGCTVNYRASQSPQFSGSIQSEYRQPITPKLDGYIRGLVSYYGDSQNDPTNLIDDVDSYALVNLYLGLRDASGAWEVALYGKNLADTERVLSRPPTPLATSYRTAVPITEASTYRAISMTDPREFGLNVRYSFGSR